jgi:NitT/TauT family transport system permease protein
VFSANSVRILIFTQIVIFLLIWMLSPTVFLPKPGEIITAFSNLWMNYGLGNELITSFTLNLEALALSTVVSLLLAYSTVVPFMRPIVALLGKLRFLSLAGLSFFFTMMASTGHELKLYLLMFSVTVFFVTSMVDVVASVPKDICDLARTLRMSEWHVAWECVILGRADQAFDVLRQNAAIGWMMISMVEGISRSEGGVGGLLLNQQKYFRLDAVFAIQICILLLGLGQDYAIGAIKKICCPYASMTLERK